MEKEFKHWQAYSSYIVYVDHSVRTTGMVSEGSEG